MCYTTIGPSSHGSTNKSIFVNDFSVDFITNGSPMSLTRHLMYILHRNWFLLTGAKGIRATRNVQTNAENPSRSSKRAIRVSAAVPVSFSLRLSVGVRAKLRQSIYEWMSWACLRQWRLGFIAFHLFAFRILCVVCCVLFFLSSILVVVVVVCPSSRVWNRGFMRRGPLGRNMCGQHLSRVMSSFFVLCASGSFCAWCITNVYIRKRAWAWTWTWVRFLHNHEMV